MSTPKESNKNNLSDSIEKPPQPTNSPHTSLYEKYKDDDNYEYFRIPKKEADNKSTSTPKSKNVESLDDSKPLNNSDSDTKYAGKSLNFHF